MQPGPIVILTGAGISAESGLGTFRDAGGIWSKYDLADVATPQGYAADPGLVLSFYNARRANAAAARPNPAHRALARLAAGWAPGVTLITQNIDALHETAGHRDVWHMHGRLDRAQCAACGHTWPWTGDMTRADGCPTCAAVGRVRPDVVWFGEVPYHLDEIAAVLARAAMFVAIGTSGTVYPAAGFVAEAARHGARTLEINLEPSEVSRLFDDRILGTASEAVPRWVDSLLGVGGPQGPHG
ncbi:MAG: Sir2 family NAD-dependent protein deacetylase [Pseudomonadota bacterium]